MTDRAKKENLRLIVLETLLKWEKEGSDSDKLINDVLETYAYLGKDSRSFIKRLSEGTVENVLLLDHIINLSSNIKIKKLKPVVRAILRMGVYQLYFMDSVPAHSSVDESVKLAKIKYLGNLSGYVNAVMRNADKNRIDIEKIDDLSVRYSCPEWIVTLLEKQYGREDTEGILRSFLGARKLYIRTNTAKITPQGLKIRLEEEGISTGEVEGLPTALELKGIDSVRSIPGFDEGLFTVQDISSMETGLLFTPFRGMKVLDLCAAPGGKCTHASERLIGYGEVEARDVSENKLELIRQNVNRLGLNNLSIRLWDATEPDSSCNEGFDIVFADLPCSGLGVIGRKNEIKYRVSPEDITSLQELQRKILDASYRYVRQGGRLIYSVCTLTYEETYDQRDYIGTLGFKLEGEKLFLPHRTGSDGFYYAVFKR